MKKGNLVLPANKNYEYGFESAYKLACEQLAELEDVNQQCLNSGAQYLEVDTRQVIVIEYLNRSYQIILPEIEILLMEGQEEVSMKDKVLILHYFLRAKGTPVMHQTVTYKDLPQAANYFPTFVKRTVKPLLSHFGKEPHRLIDAAEKLGGHKADFGDAAVTINAFRQVPITIVLWRGDDEFTPEGSILFDNTIADYLSSEDIVVLCETISWRLVKSLREA